MNTRERAERWLKSFTHNKTDAYNIIRNLLAECEKEKAHWIDRLGLCVRHGYYDATLNNQECEACRLEAECERLEKDRERIEFIYSDTELRIQSAIRQTAEGCIEVINDAWDAVDAIEAIRAKYLAKEY